MKTLFNKKTCLIIIAVVLIAVIIAIIEMMASYKRIDYKTHVQNSSKATDSSLIAPSANVIVSEISSSQSNSSLSSTSVAVDVTQSKAEYTSGTVTSSKIQPVSSKATTSTSSVISKSPSAITSSSPTLLPVPTSQEYVTKTIGNNNIRLNVNAFTFEAFVDWSSVQKYLLDDFYVKVYKNGVLKKGPTLYGCVATEPTNTVAVEIDTYQSNDHWYIEPATYTIECYCQLGEHSMITESRTSIILCPSATFTVAINERGFQ